MAAIGLKSQIWNNNLRSLLLLASYPFVIALMVWAIAFIFGWLMAGSTGAAGDDAAKAALAMSRGVVFEWWPAIATLVTIWFMIAYFFQTRMIRALCHARPVSRAEEPALYNLLENLCISRGLAVPRLEIIETHARNAFASGIDRRTYTVTVTRGLLQSLQKDEIEAVLAHELTHIINRDVRLLIVSIIFTGMIGFFAQLLWSHLRYSIYFSSRRNRDGRLMLIVLAVGMVLWLGYFATLFTRFALSRRREFMADAGAVALTKNPEAMMRALLRLSGRDKIPEATDDIALMCIENSRKFLGLFTTHPPLEARVEALSKATGTPAPTLRPGQPAFDAERFMEPRSRQNPWLTANRPGRAPPWRQD